MARTSTKIQHPNQLTDDRRPRFGIGHINLGVSDVTQSADFYRGIGMRPVVNMGRAAIVELRGGTHLILQEQRQPSPTGSLDLIVDEIDDTHALLTTLGAQPDRITRGNPHDTFTATDPSGNRLVIHSNHAMGPV